MCAVSACDVGIRAVEERRKSREKNAKEKRAAPTMMLRRVVTIGYHRPALGGEGIQVEGSKERKDEMVGRVRVGRKHWWVDIGGGVHRLLVSQQCFSYANGFPNIIEPTWASLRATDGIWKHDVIVDWDTGQSGKVG